MFWPPAVQQNRCENFGVASRHVMAVSAKDRFGLVSFNDSVVQGFGNDLVNHTALTFLIKADGTFQGTIAYEEDQDTAAAKVKRLVEG